MFLSATELETEIDYPSSDGKPMAENTVQYNWITKVKGGFEAIFRDDPTVFVAGDLLWYPVKGRTDINRAPDAMVAFGRPKGPRMSYIQHREGNTPPHVVVEILSPSNDAADLDAADLKEKFDFYQTYGVDEYYVYDPDEVVLSGWRRRGKRLVPIPNIATGYTSPRLNVHFRVEDEWILTGPDRKPFVDFPVLVDQRDKAVQRADKETRRANKEARRADNLEKKLRDLEKLMRERGIAPPEK